MALRVTAPPTPVVAALEASLTRSSTRGAAVARRTAQAVKMRPTSSRPIRAAAGRMAADDGDRAGTVGGGNACAGGSAGSGKVGAGKMGIGGGVFGGRGDGGDPGGGPGCGGEGEGGLSGGEGGDGGESSLGS